MTELKVWACWNTINDSWEYSLIPGEPIWTFYREWLAREIGGNPTREIRELSDIEIAQIPGAAAAFTAWLNIQEARERLAKARGQA